MPITRRLALLMLLMLSSAMGGILVIVWSQASTAAQLYHERLGAETQAAEQILALAGAPLRSYTTSYARWDEMAQLTQTCDRAWADANIAATAATFQADAAWVFRADGRLCYTTAPTITLSLNGLGLDARPAADMERHGFAPLDTALWEIAAATISSAADYAGATRPQGWFVVARRLDDQALSDFAALLNGQVTLAHDAGVALTSTGERDSGQLAVTYPLRDLRGAPVATLALVSARPPFRKLGRVATEVLILVGAINLATFLMLSFALTRRVLLPLRALTHSLQAAQPTALDGLAQQRDEFGQLAGLVQAFFAQHQQLTRAIVAREQADATLRSFFDGAAVMMGVVELPDDDILHLSDNAATQQFFRLPPDQPYPYRASAAGVPQEHVRLWLEHYRACARRRAPVTFEYHHQAPDGLHWLAATVSPIAAGDETPPRFAYLVQDVTERKRAEAALRESEQRWQLALDAINDGLWDWDYTTGKVFFSDRWQAMLGFAPGEVAGHIRSWEQLAHPDDLSRAQAALQAHLDGRTPSYVCEHRCRTKGGGWVWVLDRGKVIARDAGGRPLRVVGTHTNITARHLLEAELRAAEQRLRSMFERHQAIMLLIEPGSGAIVDANAAAAAFYGYPLAKLRQLDITVINQLDPAQVAAERARALAEQRNYFLFPHRLASGEIRTVEVHSTPIAIGAQTLLFSIIHDVTDRIRIEAAEREQRALAEALRDTAIALTSTLSVDAVLDRILAQVGRVVPYDAVTILLVDADDDTVAVSRRRDATEHRGTDHSGARCSLALTPALRQMACTGQPVVLATTEADPSCGESATSRWVKSYAGAPIRVRQHTVGFLTVTSATPGFFTAAHAERLQALANQAAIAIEHARLYAEVEALAVADPLTGAANRRGLFQIGIREVERARRSHTPLALIMLDIDHFKRFNDTYGHAMGDRVLCAVAACCRSIVRAIDVVARYGGEEFILLLPDTDLGSAAVAAERLRQAVERMVVPVAAEPRAFSPAIHVTASLGIGELSADAPTIEDLIEQADRALYAAKGAGRNQVWRAAAGGLAAPGSQAAPVGSRADLGRDSGG